MSIPSLSYLVAIVAIVSSAARVSVHRVKASMLAESSITNTVSKVRRNSYWFSLSDPLLRRNTLGCFVGVVGVLGTVEIASWPLKDFPEFVRWYVGIAS